MSKTNNKASLSAKRGQSFYCYLFTVFYNWLHHGQVLMTATHSTACTLVSCMAFLKRSFSSRLKILSWRCR